MVDIFEMSRRASLLNAALICDDLGMALRGGRRLSAAFNIANEEEMQALGKMFADVAATPKRIGLVGWQGVGKSAFARGMLNGTALSTLAEEKPERENRSLQGVWRRQTTGYIRIYDAIRGSENGDVTVQLPSYATNDTARYRPLLTDIVEHPAYDKHDTFFDYLIGAKAIMDGAMRRVNVIATPQAEADPRFAQFLHAADRAGLAL